MTAPALASALLDPAAAPDRRPPPPPRASIIHYDAIIDVLLTEPGLTMQELGARVRRGPVWVSMVMKSDAFLEHYKRRRAVVNASIEDAVRSRLGEVAVQAAGEVAKVLRENPHSVTFDQKLSVLDKVSGRLGFGQPQPAPSVGVTVAPAAGSTVFVASAEDLARARARYRAATAGSPVETPAALPPQPVPASAGASAGAAPVAAPAPLRGPDDDVMDLEPLAPAPDPFTGPAPQVGSDA